MTGPIDRCVALALAAIPSAVAVRFADDPVGTLRTELGMTVVAADHLNESRATGGFCDGVSYLDDGVIQYRKTGNRRENFTLGHELGHWAVDQADGAYDILGQLERGAEMLETVCDRIARAMLLPAKRVSDILGARPVDASHLAALHSGSMASGPACAVALAEKLPGVGAVVIIDRATQTVEYASVRPDGESGWPVVYPWPGQNVPAGHPLRQLATGGHLRQWTYWKDSWDREADFYVDAVADARRTVAVLSGTDLWKAERFHPTTPRDYDSRPTLSFHCCGQDHAVRGWPCSTCRDGFCPSCGNCGCGREAAREVRCAGTCFMRYRPNLLVNGLCENCR